MFDRWYVIKTRGGGRGEGEGVLISVSAASVTKFYHAISRHVGNSTFESFRSRTSLNFLISLHKYAINGQFSRNKLPP